MKFEIKSWFTGKVIYEGEGESLKTVLEMGVKAGVSFSGSDLSGSNLSDSDLSGSDLRGSNLSGSDLSGSDLTPIRDDLWAVLSSAPAEVSALRQALVEGRVDGSTYTGECACLVGTIANRRGCGINGLGVLKPNASRPAEKFFLAIKPGDTPDKNQFAALAVQWVDEWLSNIQAAFAVAK
jgi:Pentapeptide repeats (8 copies)